MADDSSFRRPPSDTATPPFTQRQLRGIAHAMLDLVLANVLYALAGIQIFGVEPFHGLQNWADNLVARANDAYYNAAVAQGSADYANAQITGLIPTDVTGGVSVSSTFDGTAGASLTGFTQVYDGPGGGSFELDGVGNAVWDKSGGLSRWCFAYHNTPLTTNYQRSRIVLSGTPQGPNFGSDPYNYVIGRVNAAGDTFVYARISSDHVTLGCYVSGSDTEFTSVSRTPNLGDVYDFYIGTDVDDYEFIIKCNGTEVTRYTDGGHTSQIGASYLYVGLGVKAANANIFTAQRVPGNVTAWGGLDRQDTSY